MNLPLRCAPLPCLFLAAMAFGLFFRFSGLGNKIYSHDEAYTSLRSAGYTGSEVIDNVWDGRTLTRDDIQLFLRPSSDKRAVDTLSAIARSQPHQSPLYFLIARFWMRSVGHSPAAMRSVSALISLLAVYGVYWLARVLFESRRPALLAATLMWLSPFHLLFAQDARPYSLTVVITLFSSAALLAALQRGSWPRWGVYAFFLAVGLYSHQIYALVAVAHALYVLMVSHPGKGVVRYLAATSVALLTFTPWLFQMVAHWSRVANNLAWADTQVPFSRYLQRWALISASPLFDLQLGQRDLLPYLLRVPVLIVIAYSLWFLIARTPRRVWAFLVLIMGATALPLIAADLLLGGVRSLNGRYFAAANVAIIPVVAHLLCAKLNQGQRFVGGWVVVTAWLIAGQLASGFNSLYADTWWNKRLSPMRPEVVKALNDSRRPLLVVYGLAPTDLGDVLALSLMVDQDVHFRLYQQPAVVDLPSDFSDIYWFRKPDMKQLKSVAATHEVQEAVPGILWRIHRSRQ